ncbi:hypothetical protein DFH07DRAFT_788846 [Mycena maculata]|uniref:RING-CH-type domain-containing protein n=1 Tax=Mycena maculata TaxID=230809 RepID=A0AAD7KE66_9AGAR|nr:hypothetical protein DFH07DRAFT_788846 [Mycena maculata]
MAEPIDERQCRICLAGAEELTLGRLIKPCLCKGSISFVHVKCLRRWRTSSASRSAFFACPQCHYKYRFARTRIVGIATNPVIVGAISAILFTLLVLLSSAVTTYFMSWFEESSDSYASYYYTRSSFFGFGPTFYVVSPLDVIRDLIRAALRILKDEDGEETIFGHGDTQFGTPVPPSEPGLLKSFLRRFLIGLPLVGAGSIVHMLLSLQMPLHLLTRYRTGNRRRDSSRDIASLIIIGLVLVGAARALVKVYGATQSLSKRILLRAEDAILEV